MSQAQIEAARAVMKGEFDVIKVMTALGNAGVANIVPGAEALLAREVKLGRVERLSSGRYRSR